MNRIYLLAGLALAFTLPLAEYGGYAGATLAHYQLPAVTLGDPSAAPAAGGAGSDVAFGQLVLGSYVLGCLVMAVLVGLRAWRTVAALRHRKRGEAFSFFGMVRIDRNTYGSDEVVHHEKVHVQQWHSADVVLMQLVKIFNWFNPVVYAYERALRLQHEYIADRKTAANNQLAYAELLVSSALGVSGPALANAFSNGNLLKRRVSMLLRDASPRYRSWRYMALLPVIVAMLLFSVACNQEGQGQEEPVAHETVAPQAESGQMPAAEEDNVLSKGDVLTDAEISPEPPGGMAEFMRYIGNNYEYPQEAIDAGVKGMVQVSFVVETDGSLTDMKIVRDLGHGTGEAALRVLEGSEKWSPAVQDGKPVRVAYTLPIRLNIQQ